MRIGRRLMRFDWLFSKQAQEKGRMKKLTLFLVICLILTCFGNVLTGVAFADTASRYTDVLEDLQKDETFNAAQYPASDKDTMDVFQVAESNAGELFLYVYSTTGDKFTASEARISQSIGDNLHAEDYKLTLLSRNGTLSKYIVNGLTVKQDTVRYYVVVQLARPWNDDVDGKPSGNEATTVPYPIGKQYTACTIDGKVTYTEVHEEVITITYKYIGYLRYYSGWAWINAKTDSWFVAFSTDRPIDKLMEAEVFYVSREYVHSKDVITDHYEYFDKQDNYALLKATTVVNNPELGIFAHKYSWREIESTSDFLREDLTDAAKEQVKRKDWVLRFAQTPFTEVSGMSPGVRTFATEITEVTILRLKFETNDIQYNLGVVDNKQTGSDTPSNNPEDLLDGFNAAIKRVTDFFNSFGDRFVKAGQWLAANWWVIIVGVVVLAIAVSLFFRVGRKAVGLVLTGIGKALWWFVKYLGIGLFYVITCPYWIIRAIVLAAKKRKQ